MRHAFSVLVLALACSAAAACDLFKKDTEPGTPTTPTPGVGLDVFAGSWSSATASTPSTGCGGLKYIVTPVNTSTANVTFSATCAGSIQVSGTGSGAVSGSSLVWNAQGLVSQGGVNCPFTFTNGQAVQDTGGIKVTYSGTVCGIPVSGTEIVKKS
jgi:hypothetical protein